MPSDRKSTRLNSSHGYISYAVFCLKKKNNITTHRSRNTRTREAATGTHGCTRTLRCASAPPPLLPGHIPHSSFVFFFFFLKAGAPHAFPLSPPPPPSTA